MWRFLLFSFTSEVFIGFSDYSSISLPYISSKLRPRIDFGVLGVPFKDWICFEAGERRGSFSENVGFLIQKIEKWKNVKLKITKKLKDCTIITLVRRVGWNWNEWVTGIYTWGNTCRENKESYEITLCIWRPNFKIDHEVILHTLRLPCELKQVSI